MEETTGKTTVAVEGQKPGVELSKSWLSKLRIVVIVLCIVLLLAVLYLLLFNKKSSKPTAPYQIKTEKNNNILQESKPAQPEKESQGATSTATPPQ